MIKGSTDKDMHASAEGKCEKKQYVSRDHIERLPIFVASSSVVKFFLDQR